VRSALNRFEARPALSLIGILAGLLLVAEGGLRIVRPQALEFVHEARQVHRYSRRWGVDLVPERTALLRIGGPDGGDVLNFVLTTDEDAMRGPDRRRDRRRRRPGDRYVHAVGDSYTMGWGVAYEASYPAELERLLGPPFVVLNMGVDGYGAIAATEKSMAVSGRYPPAIAVYLFSPNDFEDDRKAVSVSRRSRLAHVAAEVLDGFRRRSYLMNLPFALRWKLYFERANEAPPSGGQVDPRVLFRADPRIDPGRADLPVPDVASPTLAQIRRYARFLGKRGAPLLVLALSNRPASLSIYRFCRDEHIPCRLIEVPSGLRLAGEGHFGTLGNAQVARFVCGEVERLVSPREAATAAR
jgi:hypothetical protein